ncbi:hypothetical protein V1264_010173 [Littorina saxatilis]|uniref:Uncharacterized protein n=1 Tax=Littorina saxatilis TaxID=31220 RepID=A0AAN9G1C1_9CAEN
MEFSGRELDGQGVAEFVFLTVTVNRKELFKKEKNTQTWLVNNTRVTSTPDRFISRLSRQPAVAHIPPSTAQF